MIVEEHLERARTFARAGEREAAEAEFLAALAINPDLVEAHVGLSKLRLPGPGYLFWLNHFHDAYRPRLYLEIGVATGNSLALVRPPTRAVGIDPQPRIASSMPAGAHLHVETSDEYFAADRLRRLFDADRIDMAFIDGLHEFEQVLRDFINVEAHCAPGSLILLHDTLPLDDATQTSEQLTTFWSGDVWKILPCLRRYRPDLRIATIATAPTGLTAITGLDPQSNVLADRYDEAVGRFSALPYSVAAQRDAATWNVVPNDFEAVETLLAITPYSTESA